jgi:hypothetical protein
LQKILRCAVDAQKAPVFGAFSRKAVDFELAGIGSIGSLMALFLQTSGLRPLGTDFLSRCSHGIFSTDLRRTFRKTVGERGI